MLSSPSLSTPPPWIRTGPWFGLNGRSCRREEGAGGGRGREDEKEQTEETEEEQEEQGVSSETFKRG
eukprot:767683-Hanusia_phi.AAC.2